MNELIIGKLYRFEQKHPFYFRDESNNKMVLLKDGFIALILDYKVTNTADSKIDSLSKETYIKFFANNKIYSKKTLSFLCFEEYFKRIY